MPGAPPSGGKRAHLRWDGSAAGKRAVEKAEDRLLDVREAAAMLGLKPATLYQWAYERRIPVVKLFGRSLRFRLSIIQKLIASFERPAMRDRMPSF